MEGTYIDSPQPCLEPASNIRKPPSQPIAEARIRTTHKAIDGFTLKITHDEFEHTEISCIISPIA
jgi:hypothetical protein